MYHLVRRSYDTWYLRRRSRKIMNNHGHNSMLVNTGVQYVQERGGMPMMPRTHKDNSRQKETSRPINNDCCMKGNILIRWCDLMTR